MYVWASVIKESSLSTESNGEGVNGGCEWVLGEEHVPTYGQGLILE